MELVAARLDDERTAHQFGGLAESVEILERERQIIERVGIVGTKLQRSAIDGFGFVRPFQLAQTGAEIIPCVSKIRHQLEGAAVRRLGVGETLETLQRIAAITVRLGKAVVERDGAVIELQCLFEFALIEQGNAEVAQGARIVRIDFQRAPAGRDRFVDASGEPAHLAEIGVIERNVRLDGDRAANMLDRFAELAGLMGDDAEHVLGLGVIRRGSGGAPRQVVGVGQKSVPSFLFGKKRAPGPD